MKMEMEMEPVLVVCFISNCGSTWNWNQLGVTVMKERPVKLAVYK
jgi:hypothetical protein